jgi:hypothetical protein
MYFPSGYVPLDPTDYMLSEKLLEGVGIDTFAGKNGYRRGVNLPLSLLASLPSALGRHVRARPLYRSFFI